MKVFCLYSFLALIAEDTLTYILYPELNSLIVKAVAVLYIEVLFCYYDNTEEPCARGYSRYARKYKGLAGFV